MVSSSQFQLVELQQALYKSKNLTRRWLHCIRRDWLVDAIYRLSINRPRISALEVGPGSGIYLPFLVKRFEKVVASDIEAAYLEHLSVLRDKYKNLELVLDDISNSNLPECSFDLILCSEVIEHIQNSSKAIIGMYHLLKPGGLLILSTPQRGSLLEVLSKIAFLPGFINIVRLVYDEPILKTGHINLLTEDKVVKQLNSAGFHICEQFKSGIYLPLIAEFTGEWGLKLAQRLEKRIRGTFFDWLLWTQYYVVKKPSHSDRLNSCF